jgi:hypothetical protein
MYQSKFQAIKIQNILERSEKSPGPLMPHHCVPIGPLSHCGPVSVAATFSRLDHISRLSSLKPVYASPMAGGLTMATHVPANPCTACTLSPYLPAPRAPRIHTELRSVVIMTRIFMPNLVLSVPQSLVS